jgi:MFS family permease
VRQEEDTATNENGLRYNILLWSTVCAVCTSFAFASYSLFLPAFLAEFHWARGAAALPFSLAMVCWGAMQPVAGALADRWGTRPVILAGILVSALGFLTMGMAQSLWQVALGFGVLLGTATSACGSLLWALLISKWFPGARRGAAVGILQAATPASPLVLAPVLFVLMAQYGWRAAAVFLALVLLLIAFPLAWCVVQDPPAAAGPAPGASAAPQRGRVQDVLELLRRGPLRNLMLARVACGLSFFLIPHLAAAATAAGLTPAQGATAVALYGLASTVGALAGGLAADRWGRVPTLMATYGLRGLGALALALPGMPAAWFYPAMALAAGPIFATVTINTVQTFELVGPQRAGLILGVSFVVHQVAAAVSPYASGLLFDATGSYRLAFSVLGVVMLLALLPAAGTHPEGDPHRAQLSRVAT